ncbi:hypothetical protein [Bacteroides nordii]|mgnify:CR=1 FL=1|uniref:hypothetical protein n=1 Tax=Bacteroides nordii TaxID=291645 RepID=UPI00399AC6A4
MAKYYLFLVETLQHQKCLKEEILRYINSFLSTNRERASVDLSFHYFTLVSYNNDSYKILIDEMDLTEVALLEDIEFDKELSYYKYGCTYYVLDTFIEKVQQGISNWEDTVSINIISGGRNNTVEGHWGLEILRLIQSKQEQGWRFCYSRMDVVNRQLKIDQGLRALFGLDTTVLFHFTSRPRTLTKNPEEVEVVKEKKGEKISEKSEMLSLISLAGNDSFSLNDIQYTSFRDFCRRDETYQPGVTIQKHGFYVLMNHKGQLMLEYSRLYPCFDSYDYANEDRFHRNYWLCKDEQELMVKYEYITHNRFCYSNDDYSTCPMPVFLGPAVFYDDGTSVVKIGE